MAYPSYLLCDGFGHHTDLVSLEQVKPRLLRVQVLDHAWHVSLGGGRRDRHREEGGKGTTAKRILTFEELDSVNELHVMRLSCQFGQLNSGNLT